MLFNYLYIRDFLSCLLTWWKNTLCTYNSLYTQKLFEIPVQKVTYCSFLLHGEQLIMPIYTRYVNFASCSWVFVWHFHCFAETETSKTLLRRNIPHRFITATQIFFYCSLNWFLPTAWVWAFSELLCGIRWFIHIRRNKWLWFKPLCSISTYIQFNWCCLLLLMWQILQKFSDCTTVTGLVPLYIVNCMDVMRTGPLWWDWLQSKGSLVFLYSINICATTSLVWNESAA